MSSTLHKKSKLTYVGDTEPGIQRRRAGRGFSYKLPDGRIVKDKDILARIRALAIPPAWEDVWICMDDRGHIQATGRDVKGRKQYRYNEAWSAFRDEAKFTSLTDFARHLPRLRETVARDLARRGTPPERVLAAVVWLLDRTMIRVGGEAYMHENDSYGAATLQNRHMQEEGSALRFVFTGKAG